MRSLQLIAALAAYRLGDETTGLAVLQSAAAMPAEDLSRAFQVTLRSGDLDGSRAQALLAFLRSVGDEAGSLDGDEELGPLRQEAEDLEKRLRELRRRHQAVEPMRSRVKEQMAQRDELLRNLQAVQAEITELERQRARADEIDGEVSS